MTIEMAGILASIGLVIAIVFWFLLRKPKLHGYATTLNCMDGAVQAPARKFMKIRFGVEFVDPITEPGIVKILADESGDPEMEFIRNQIRKKLWISLISHGSRKISIGAHGASNDPHIAAEGIIWISLLLWFTRARKKLHSAECLGNPGRTKEEQKQQLRKAKKVVQKMIAELELDVEVVLLWINGHLMPEEVFDSCDDLYCQEVAV